MPSFHRLTAMLLSFVLLGLPLPAQAKTRKGDRFLSEGRTHEERKEWDAAVDAYERALSEDPSELAYQMAAQKARFQASAMHLSGGLKQREQGQLGEALLEFQRAYALSPSSSVAQQEIILTQQMIQTERKRVELSGKESAPEVRALTPAAQARKELADKIDRLLPVPELRPLRPNLQDFKFNNQTPKSLFDTLALNAGLNITYDPEYITQGPKERLSVALDNTTVQEALDYLSILTRSYWKPLSANTIFITADTLPKRRDFEDEVTRLFYLTNVTNNADLTAIVTAIRQVADCTRVFPIEFQSVIVAKCAADKMALTEKIVQDLDKARAEVVVDIFVIEAGSVYARNLTTAITPTGINMPVNSTPRTSLQVQQAASTPAATPAATGTPATPASNGSSAIPLSHVGQLNAGDFATILPNALFQATLNDTHTKVLQSPQLRSVDGQKVTMKIGEREPTATGSFQPGSGGLVGGGVSPLVNTQFNFLDVGVNVEILPHVHENGDVSLKVSLDISNVTGNKNLGGIDQPIIGQRKIEQEIRLREGEVSLLAGLLNQQDSRIRTGTPGLANIPLLGRLFRGESVDRERNELMIALVPHVVRRAEVTEENLRAIGTGSSVQVSVRRGPKPLDGAPRETARREPPPADAAPPPAPGAGIHFNRSQLEASSGDTFSVELLVDDAHDVVAAPFQFRFDPKVLTMTSVSAGKFWSGDGAEAQIARNIQNDVGTAGVLVSRQPGASAVAGSGILLVLNFQALAPGTASVEAPTLTLNNAQNQPVASGSPVLSVRVR